MVYEIGLTTLVEHIVKIALKTPAILAGALLLRPGSQQTNTLL